MMLLHAAVWVATLAVAIGGGWLATEAVLHWARVPPQPMARQHVRDVDAPVLTPMRPQCGVLRGGAWIGVLERAALVTCVLAGQPALISLVVAVKGLGRYPQLREAPEIAERFLIGSATSLLWAGWAALAGAALLRWI